MLLATRSTCWRGPILFVLSLITAVGTSTPAAGADQPTNQVGKAAASNPLAAVLSPAKWQQVEASVDRALAWLASQQTVDGSFSTLPAGQPAVTSLCVLAFLS